MSKSAMYSPKRQDSPDRSFEVSADASPNKNNTFHSASANNLMAFNTPDRRTTSRLAYQSEREVP